MQLTRHAKNMCSEATPKYTTCMTDGEIYNPARITEAGAVCGVRRMALCGVLDRWRSEWRGR